MIIGVSGLAGSGKDTAADFLVKNHGFVRIGLADPLKRICKEAFDFTDEQLWGPSSERNEPDKRYLRARVDVAHMLAEEFNKELLDEDGLLPQYLSPRHALQQLGTEWGRGCYKDVWIDYGLRVAKKLLKKYTKANYGDWVQHYSAKDGLYTGGHFYVGDQLNSEAPEATTTAMLPQGVVFSDIRFKNEMAAIKKAGFLWRMKRGKGLGGDAGLHPSEAEQGEVSDKGFDVVIDNNNITLQNLELVVSDRLGMLKARLKARL